MNGVSILTVVDLTKLKTAFDRDGVVVQRGLLDEADIHVMQEEVQRLWQTQLDLRAQNLRVALRHNSKGEWALDRLDPVADISTVFQQVNNDPRLLLLVQTLLGGEVRVLKEKIIYKRPGVEGFGFHRDEPYFGLSGVPGDEMVSLCIAIDPTTAENGATEFYPQLRLRELQSVADEPRDIAESELAKQPPLKPFLQPGDAVMFDGLIPHRAAMNHSSQSRCTYFVTYAPVQYVDCRERYYRYRELEQAEERAKEFAGPFYIIDADNQRREVNS